jgi:hypothetical protein
MSQATSFRIKSNLLICLISVTPLFINLLTEKSIATNLVKILAIFLAIAFREKEKNKLHDSNTSLVYFFALVVFLQFSNFVNSSPLQLNMYFHLFWFYYIFSQSWFRKSIMDSSLIFVQFTCLVSILLVVFHIQPNNLSLSTNGYFVPLTDFLKLSYRQQGIFSHPNTYSLYCFILIALTLIVKNSIGKFWLLVALFGLLVSGSRTFQYLSLLLIFFQLRYHVVKKLDYRLKPRAVFIIYFLLVSFFIFLQFTNIPSVNEASLTGRYGIWTICLRELSPQMIYGLGSNYSDKFTNLGLLPSNANSVHSLYLDPLISGGIIACLLFICFLNRLIRNVSTFNNNYRFIFVCFLVSGIAETIWSVSSFSIISILFAYFSRSRSLDD